MRIEDQIVLTAINSLNENNEVEPINYVVEVIHRSSNKELIVKTTDFAYAMQCFINRCN